MSTKDGSIRARKGEQLEPQGHHLMEPFQPQTPFESRSTTPNPSRPVSPSFRPASPRRHDRWSTESQGFWHDTFTLRWAIAPSSAAKLLAIPVVLYINWEIITLFVESSIPNPFAPFLFIQYPLLISDSPTSPAQLKYGKGPLDGLFIFYYIILFSFLRQLITLKLFRPLAQQFGIKRQTKLDRFGEQGYAVLYFGIVGCWDIYLMNQLPTWWFRTEYFWIDYPHWQMTPSMKRYYLMQVAYWIQQALVLVLGLEKPRKDYWELVGHHVVTLWMVIMSYWMNLSHIGNAMFLSMDIPEVFLAFSKLLNYMQFETAKVFSFALFVPIWTYFRHWLNWCILYSVWFEWKLIPQHAQKLSPHEGFWLPTWVQQQIFWAIAALQALQLFWYLMILKILFRAITTSKTTDSRSDDEDDEEDEEDADKEKED